VKEATATFRKTAPEQKDEPIEPLFDGIQSEPALRPANHQATPTRISNGSNRVPDDFAAGSGDVVPPVAQPGLTNAELDQRATILEEKCREFNVSGQVQRHTRGPVVTTFEFKPDTE
jgi:DNA segregation ATPase FtsK/SpoIIIE-like protein